MGFDFKCGCRRSGNMYFLCQRHENMLECEEVCERKAQADEQKEKCICNRGIHDSYNIDCACKCHKED